MPIDTVKLHATDLELDQMPMRAHLSVKTGRPNGWIDLLRHVLIVAVIFQHMAAESRYPTELNALIRSLTPAIDGAVACFFLISGYFARPGDSWRHVLQRVLRLLAPYVMFSVIYAAILIALGKMNAMTAVDRIIIGAGIGPQLYYLPYLALISTSLNFLAWRHRKADVQAILLTLLAVYVMVDTPNSTGPDSRLLVLYTLAYSLGMYIARHAKTMEMLILAVVSLIAVFWFPWTSRYFDLPLVILLFLCTLHADRLGAITRRVPGSGGAYLLHTPVLNFAISTILWKYGLHGVANVAVAIALTYIVALAMTLGTIRYAARYRWLLLE